jgi:hypothetical protein
MDFNAAPYKDSDQFEIPAEPVDIGADGGTEPEISLGSGGYMNFNRNELKLPGWLSDDERDEITLEGMVTVGRNRKAKVDELKDDVAGRLIAQAQKESQDREAMLLQSLEEAENAMRAQAPQVSPQVSLSPHEMWATLISSAITGRPAEMMNAGYSIAAQRQKVEFENQMRQFGLSQQASERLWQNLNRELGAERSNQERLTAMQVQQANNLADDQRARDKFEQELGVRQGELDLKNDRESRLDRQAQVNSFNEMVVKYWDRLGSMDPADVAALKSQRDALVAAGVPDGLLMQIPTQTTAKVQDMQADNTRQDTALQHKMQFDWAKFDEQINQFTQKRKDELYKFGENQKRLKKEFDQKVREFNTKVSSGYFTKEPRARADAISKVLDSANKASSNADVQLTQVTAELEAARTKLAGMDEKAFGRYDLEQKIDDLETKRAGLKAVADAWQAKRRELLPPIDQARSEAARAIEEGRDPSAVRSRFKQLYGEDL